MFVHTGFVGDKKGAHPKMSWDTLKELVEGPAHHHRQPHDHPPRPARRSTVRQADRGADEVQGRPGDEPRRQDRLLRLSRGQERRDHPGLRPRRGLHPRLLHRQRSRRGVAHHPLRGPLGPHPAREGPRRVRAQDASAGPTRSPRFPSKTSPGRVRGPRGRRHPARHAARRLPGDGRQLDTRVRGRDGQAHRRGGRRQRHLLRDGRHRRHRQPADRPLDGPRGSLLPDTQTAHLGQAPQPPPGRLGTDHLRHRPLQPRPRQRPRQLHRLHARRHRRLPRRRLARPRGRGARQEGPARPSAPRTSRTPAAAPPSASTPRAAPSPPAPATPSPAAASPRSWRARA